MILRIPTAGRKYLTAEQVREHNALCAAIAQLKLAGATIEDETEKVRIDPNRRDSPTTMNVVDPVPEPFAEPTEIKCDSCGYEGIVGFSVVFYQRVTQEIRGFTKRAHIAVMDDRVHDDLYTDDKRPEAAALAGVWLRCQHCDHEQKPKAHEEIFWE